MANENSSLITLSGRSYRIFNASHFHITLSYPICQLSAILFGSRARGNNTERSDVDIAVYGGDFDSFYWDIKENIHSLLMFDVINADASISEELKKEIKKDGVVIYEKA